MPEGAVRRDDQFIGCLDLGGLWRPRLVRRHESPRHGGQVAAAALIGVRQLSHQTGVGLVRDEVDRELGGDVVGGLRAGGEVDQRLQGLRLSGVGIAVSKEDPLPRFVHIRAVQETPRALETLPGPPHGPAGQRPRELGHIVLGVARICTEAVQFHDLAGEVLVQPARAAKTRRTVGADGLGLIQIDHHPRVPG